MPNGEQWEEIFKNYTTDFFDTLNKPIDFDAFFSDDNIGTVVDGGTTQIPVHYMSRRIRLQDTVSKAKHCTYLDWKPATGGRT